MLVHLKEFAPTTFMENDIWEELEVEHKGDILEEARWLIMENNVELNISLFSFLFVCIVCENVDETNIRVKFLLLCTKFSKTFLLCMEN
jgi:hypothetical protein